MLEEIARPKVNVVEGADGLAGSPSMSHGMHRRSFLQACGLAALPLRPARAQPAQPVRIASFTPLQTFDPLLGFSADAYIMRAVFPPLLRIAQRTPAPAGGCEPFAATASALLSDQRTNKHFIDLRAEPQRVWADGTRNGSREIARGIERARQRPPLAQRDGLRNIAAVEVMDDLLCRLHLGRKDATIFKELLAREWATPLTESGRRALEARKILDYKAALGPYQFAEPFLPGEVVTLKANPYWARKSPGIPVFSIRRYPSLEVALAHLRAGQVDLVPLADGQIVGRLGDDSTFRGSLAELHSMPVESVTYVAMDTGGGATQRTAARFAVRAALDPTAVAERVFGKVGAEPTSDFIPRSLVVEFEPCPALERPRDRESGSRGSGIP